MDAFFLGASSDSLVSSSTGFFFLAPGFGASSSDVSLDGGSCLTTFFFSLGLTLVFGTFSSDREVALRGVAFLVGASSSEDVASSTILFFGAFFAAFFAEESEELDCCHFLVFC